METNSVSTISPLLLKAFDMKTDHRLLYRRLGITAGDTRTDDATFQMDLFTDYEALDKEARIQKAMLAVRQRYGANAVVKGMNLMEGATTMERNNQIGGHRR
jgi:DNA polymerase V